MPKARVRDEFLFEILTEVGSKEIELKGPSCEVKMRTKGGEIKDVRIN
ncbi:MAG: hypothetical protein GXO39_08340, partial [Thermotogae bacterium]|nr:hypothetical protein [Thermotogota bacterium]